MKARKILVSVAALALVAAISIAGTLAYLTDKANVTNTFTVGNVGITMDEAQLDKDGMNLLDKNNAVTDEVANAARTDKNTYKLMPGHTYVKDPTIKLTATSEDCYLFVTVENGLAGAEGENTIEKQMEALGWVAVKNTDGKTVAYAWHGKAGTAVNEKAQIVTKTSDGVKVFDTFTFGNMAKPGDYAQASIVVKAYAIQADGLSEQTDLARWNLVANAYSTT